MKYLPAKYDISCCGVNHVSEIVSPEPGVFEVKLGRFGTKSLSGDFVEKLSTETFEAFSKQVKSLGFLVERKGPDLYPLPVTFFRTEHRNVCGRVINTRLQDNEDGTQALYGTIDIFGPMGDELSTFLHENKNGVAVFSHKTLCRKSEDRTTRIDRFVMIALIDLIDYPQAAFQQQTVEAVSDTVALF